MLLGEVANPTPAKNVGEVEVTLNKWEKNDMNIAIMTSILPAVIQDILYQHVDNKTKYADISEKVKAWVGNRVGIVNEPIPIDIGEVGWGSDDYNMQAEETEIDMVVCAWTKCHRCDGYGHLSRDCATPAKGKGKDGKGGQKGYGKGGHHYQQ